MVFAFGRSAEENIVKLAFSALMLAAVACQTTPPRTNWLELVVQEVCYVGFTFPNLHRQDFNYGSVQRFMGETADSAIRIPICINKVYQYYDMETGAMEPSENYVRHNVTFIEPGKEKLPDGFDCAAGLGFWGPRVHHAVVRNRAMRIEEYVYCCKSIVASLRNKRRTVCNTPNEIRVAVREALAQSQSQSQSRAQPQPSQLQLQ